MANKTENATKKRAKKKVIREDLYNRFELTGDDDGIFGEFFVPKGGDNIANSETVTITVTSTY